MNVSNPIKNCYQPFEEVEETLKESITRLHGILLNEETLKESITRLHGILESLETIKQLHIKRVEFEKQVLLDSTDRALTNSGKYLKKRFVDGKSIVSIKESVKKMKSALGFIFQYKYLELDNVDGTIEKTKSDLKIDTFEEMEIDVVRLYFEASDFSLEKCTYKDGSVYFVFSGSLNSFREVQSRFNSRFHPIQSKIGHLLFPNKDNSNICPDELSTWFDAQYKVMTLKDWLLKAAHWKKFPKTKTETHQPIYQKLSVSVTFVIWMLFGSIACIHLLLYRYIESFGINVH